jgi:hypothetical protein
VNGTGDGRKRENTELDYERATVKQKRQSEKQQIDTDGRREKAATVDGGRRNDNCTFGRITADEEVESVTVTSAV